MKENVFNFTPAKINKLQNNSGKIVEYFDSTQKGLVLRISKSGKTKTLRMMVWDKNTKKQIREVLGHFPETTLKEARQEVAKRIADITRGVDVIARKKEIANELTLNEAWLEYYDTYDEGKKSQATLDEDDKRYNLYIKKHAIGKKSFSEISDTIFIRWRKDLRTRPKQRGSGYLSMGTINRVSQLIGVLFNKFAPQLVNPLESVGKYVVAERKRFLKPQEIQNFFEALSHLETPAYLRHIVLIALFTGARFQNIVAMKWRDIDFDLQLWFVSREEVKNKDDHTKHLDQMVLDILEERKEYRDSIFVFPGTGKKGHLSSPKKSWATLLKRAGIPQGFDKANGFVFHDLRRTLGSYSSMTGSSQKLVGSILGHKSTRSTDVYTHMDLGAERVAIEKAVDAIRIAAESPKKVFKLKQKA